MEVGKKIDPIQLPFDKRFLSAFDKVVQTDPTLVRQNCRMKSRTKVETVSLNGPPRYFAVL